MLVKYNIEDIVKNFFGYDYANLFSDFGESPSTSLRTRPQFVYTTLPKFPYNRSQYVVSNNEKEAVFEFNLAGFSKDEISLSYKKSNDKFVDGTFTVTTTRKQEDGSSKTVKNLTYKESLSNAFDLSKMTSQFYNGILTVTDPRVVLEPQKQDEIKVTID